MAILPFVSFIAIKSGSPEDLLDRTLQTSENISWEANGTIICDADFAQVSPKMISDGSGGAIIVWIDSRFSGTTGFDIYAQKINSAGAVQWTTNGTVICNATGNQLNHQIASDGSGGAIITWEDIRNSNVAIFAQKINSAGITQWDANGTVICNATADNYKPQIVSDDLGDAIISWGHDNGITDIHIYAQKINSAGITQWDDNGTVICNATGDQEVSRIVSDGSGGAIITWEDLRGPNTDIYAQKINSAGITQWDANGTIICNATGEQLDQQITSDNAGGAIITWEDLRGPNTDIYAQKINSAGITQWDDNGTVICNATGEQLYHQIASDGSGGLIITWRDNRNSGITNTDIYAQKIDSTGITQWTTNGTVICNATNVQYNPQIASDGAGGAIITFTWIYDIYTQKINSAGITQWNANGTAVCTDTGDQFGQEIVSDGAGGAIITWHDYRGPDSDIYAQKISDPPSNGGNGGNGGPIPGFDLVIIGVISAISVIIITKMHNKKNKLMFN